MQQLVRSLSGQQWLSRMSQVQQLASQKNELEAQLLQEVSVRCQAEQQVQTLQTEAEALVSQMQSPQIHSPHPLLHSSRLEPQLNPLAESLALTAAVSPAVSEGFGKYLLGSKSGSSSGSPERSTLGISASSPCEAQIAHELHESGHWNTVWRMFQQFAPRARMGRPEFEQMCKSDVAKQANLPVPELLRVFDSIVDDGGAAELCSVEDFGICLHQCAARVFNRAEDPLAKLLSCLNDERDDQLNLEESLAAADDDGADASVALDKYSFALISIFTRYCQVDMSAGSKQFMSSIDFSRFCNDYKIIPILTNEKTLRRMIPKGDINFSDFLLYLWRLACIGFAGRDYRTSAAKATALSTFLQI